MHDWFSKRGQGFGGEYRYVRGPRLARRHAQVYNLREHESTYTSDSDGRRPRHARAHQLRGPGER